MKIAIGFSRGKGFVPLSWGIRLVQWSKYSHTYIHFLDEHFVFEAGQSGVKSVFCRKWKKKNKIIKEVIMDITPERKVELMKFVNKHTNKTKYSNWQLVVIFFNLPFDNGASRMICSELVVRALYVELGIDIEKDRFDRFTPNDLYKLTKERFPNG